MIQDVRTTIYAIGAGMLLLALSACGQRVASASAQLPTTSSNQTEEHSPTSFDRANAFERNFEDSVMADARSFLFAQVELIESGIDPREMEQVSSALAMMGREDLLEAGLPPYRPPFCARRWIEPLNTVTNAARETSIVIINERRDTPRHRQFILDLLTRLSAEGYSVYANDTLALRDGVFHPSLPLTHEGFYTREPIHGRLIRHAKAMGMEIVAFEQSPGAAVEDYDKPQDVRIDNGETARMKNLMLQVLDGRPDAKIIIHIGGDGLREMSPKDDAEPGTNPGAESGASGGADTRRLAQRIKDATGIDPLTLAQTDCTSPMGRMVAVPSMGTGISGRLGADLMIGHPGYYFQGGRPIWRRLAGDQPAAIPAEFLEQSQPVIVEARRAGDPGVVVPEDRVLVFPGENLELMLPTGTYRIEAWTQNGPVAGPVELTVE